MRFLAAPIVIAIVALVALFSFTGQLELAYTAAILAIVEISLSFDNAVVNATKLQTMSKYWQKIFMTVGIAIAVIGMRFLLPLLIVDVAGHTGFANALNMARYDHEQFKHILTSSHHLVAGFGGMFLLLTAFNYFLDEEKETHWLGFIEAPMANSELSRSAVHVVLAALVAVVFYTFNEDLAFLWACAVGLIVFCAVQLVQKMLGYFDEHAGSTSLLSAGLAAFIYLEILDAAFSFDGVIAAFAISKDIIVVACGLGIGAMFVRALTVHLVETGSLAEYRYLENGAFWSIFTLALLMFFSVSFDVPEYVTGTLSVLWIGSAFWSSIRWNTKQKLGLVS